MGAHAEDIEVVTRDGSRPLLAGIHTASATVDGDSETELGMDAVGDIEIMMKGDTCFLTELQIGFGDIHDFKLMVGWTF